MSFKKRGAVKNAQHTPINPLTGKPNDFGGSIGVPSVDPVPEAPHPDEAPSSSSTPEVSLGHIDDVLERFGVLLDSRVISLVVLTLLLFELMGVSNLIPLLAILLIGYVFIDRFVDVRRAVTMGGLAWFLVMFAGTLITRRAGSLFLSIDYLFTFCGFFLAVAICCSFFAGRAMFEYGCRRGRERADEAIARHMVDRLVEHRDSWDHLDGDFLEVEGAINRVRERERQSSQALRDEARRKDDLVTYLAHDLKTPLASVVGYLSLLEEAPDLPVEQRVRFTGVALEKAHRLDALIEEFFDITRFDFHDIVLTRGYVDLALMLAQVVDEFYPILSEQGKTARVDVPAGLTVLVDGDKMARVFNNIMRNAIAYSYEGTEIGLSAERAETGEVRIRFENQGDPIPEPKLRVIFEKFYRLDAARATNRGGAGLGLAIAKEIVVAHGGSISCASSPERTVFTVELPA
ncbi:MAG: HAMP domain-containing sensor histidine kinase [Collinsella sp.]|nr:HAMP domain-containing sensor histidine kinase [Collinsella sp.]